MISATFKHNQKQGKIKGHGQSTTSQNLNLWDRFSPTTAAQNEKKYGRAYVWEAQRPGWQLLVVYQSQSVTAECLSGLAHQGTSCTSYQPIYISVQGIKQLSLVLAAVS